MDKALARVLAPFDLGPIPLRNRVVVPGHTTNFGDRNQPTGRHAAYHAERARGGAGLIITEAVRVHPTSAGRHASLGSFDDDSIPGFAAIADAVHVEGGRIIAQIMHAGRQARGDATRTAAWSSSPLPWATGAHVPHVMGRRDIDVVVKAFGAASRRMADAGYDGVEVHAGHGHLLQQFLSPVTNVRTDEYGGDAERRLRLTREVLAAVTTGAPSLPVGIRVSADEFLEGGLHPDAVVDIVGRLSAEFPLLYVHVSHSAYHGSWSLSTQIADMSFGHAPFRHHAVTFKTAFPDLPVIAVCRLDSLPEAAELVEAGEADLVGLARPHIADPHLVRKAEEGNVDETRSCLACNQACIARVELSLPISCVVNPEVGAEREWSNAWKALAASYDRRRVLVVGGGPAGLQAALSADRAGHQVVLAERSAQLGGQVALAARLPGRERLGLLTRDLERELRASSVEIRTGTTLDVEAIVAGDFDDVIVATGSRPSTRALSAGIEVLNSWQAVHRVVDDPGWSPGAVVILDDEGGWPAACLADAMAARDIEVHVVSPTASLASQITTYSRLALVQRMRDAHTRVHMLRSAVVHGPGCVVITDLVSGATTMLTDIGAVIDVGPAIADDAIYRSLDALPDGPSVHVVGDANAPRTALEAVYEGRMAGAFLGRLDSPEARVVAATY